MNGHAKFSPSAAHRWLKCGYSIKMEPFYPNTSSRAADEGTLKHGIAAMHLENGTDPSDDKLKIYTNTVRNVAIDGELHIERKVTIVPDLCTGTADAGVVSTDWLHVFDLKYGKTPVHATDNEQMMLYAIGFMNEYHMPADAPIDLTIVQPNAASGWPVKTWTTTVAHLEKFEAKVLRAVEEGLKESPKAVAGSHCYWCKAKMHCQAYLTHVGKR